MVGNTGINNLERNCMKKYILVSLCITWLITANATSGGLFGLIGSAINTVTGKSSSESDSTDATNLAKNSKQDGEWTIVESPLDGFNKISVCSARN